MISDNIKAIGTLRIDRFDEAIGQKVETREVKNLVVQAGKVFIASRMVAASAPLMSHMAIGTGTTTPASTDNSLTTEVARVAMSTTPTSADNVVTYIALFPAGVGTGALTEAGIFNDVASGSMLSHTTFAVVNKGANDSISITWSITIQ